MNLKLALDESRKTVDSIDVAIPPLVLEVRSFENSPYLLARLCYCDRTCTKM